MLNGESNVLILKKLIVELLKCGPRICAGVKVRYLMED